MDKQQADAQRDITEGLKEARRGLNEDEIERQQDELNDVLADIDTASGLLNTELHTNVDYGELEDEFAALGGDLGMGEGVGAGAAAAAAPAAPAAPAAAAPAPYMPAMPAVPAADVRTQYGMPEPPTARPAAAAAAGAGGGGGGMLADLAELEAL
jgi:hypothetical protein